jgi:DNA-binding winged helix-turn-helix (wHTH) protein
MPLTSSQGAKEYYGFGPFRVDPEREVLLRGVEPVPLTPKTFQILMVLVRHSKEVVSKDDLMKMVWPDTFVEEANLSRNIFMLRKALGENPQDHRYIITVPGRGYRFAEDVQLLPEREVNVVAARHSRIEVQAEKTSSKLWIIAAVALAIIAVAAVTFRVFYPRAPVLTEKDTVVLADFANSTRDPVFDGALRQGMAVQLEQSPFLSIASDQQIQQTLQMMGQKADLNLAPDIAREVCQRIGSAVVLDGSIAQIGTQYLLTLRAVNCKSGESLASTEAQASDKNHVLDALGKTASEMRAKLGESSKTWQKFDTPLELATTPSLEALKAYSLGRKASANSDWASAVPFLQQAIHFDPNFPMAYARLGTCYRNLGETKLGYESTEKAYKLRERVSKGEKFYIESHYYENVTGNLEKARQVNELWAQTYPRDWQPLAPLYTIYSSLGQSEKALEVARNGLRLNSTSFLSYSMLISAYINLNRLEEARGLAEEAQAEKYDFPDLHSLLYQLAFFKNDAAGMAQQVGWATSKLGAEDILLALEANTAAYSGGLGKARGFSNRAVTSAMRAEEKEVAANYEANAAWREAVFGNLAHARQRASAALALSAGRDVQYLTALALSFARDASRARALADNLAMRFPEDTLVQFNYLPALHAQLSLSRNNVSNAIEVLQAAAPYELSVTELSVGGSCYPVYIRGQAYLSARHGREATAEFQKILDHRGIVVNDPIGALAHLQIGRAYAMAGDTTRARAAYQDFLTLWKDADPDIPILKQAKSEYAKLQ